MYILHKWGINRNLSNRFLNFRFSNDIPFTVYDNDVWSHDKIFSLTKWLCVAQPCIDGLKSIQFIRDPVLGSDQQFLLAQKLIGKVCSSW